MPLQSRARKPSGSQPPRTRPRRPGKQCSLLAAKANPPPLTPPNPTKSQANRPPPNPLRKASPRTPSPATPPPGPNAPPDAPAASGPDAAITEQLRDFANG